MQSMDLIFFFVALLSITIIRGALQLMEHVTYNRTTTSALFVTDTLVKVFLIAEKGCMFMMCQ